MTFGGGGRSCMFVNRNFCLTISTSGDWYWLMKYRGFKFSQLEMSECIEVSSYWNYILHQMSRSRPISATGILRIYIVGQGDSMEFCIACVSNCWKNEYKSFPLSFCKAGTHVASSCFLCLNDFILAVASSMSYLNAVLRFEDWHHEFGVRLRSDRIGEK